MTIAMLGYPISGPVMLAHAILPVGGPSASGKEEGPRFGKANE